MTLEIAQESVARKDGYSNFDAIPEEHKLEYMKRAARIYAENYNTSKKLESEEKLLKELKFAFRMLLENSEVDINKLIITNFELVESNDIAIIILITLERPGLLIGRAGQLINELTNSLSAWFDNKTIEIKVKESRLWY